MALENRLTQAWLTRAREDIGDKLYEASKAGAGHGLADWPFEVAHKDVILLLARGVTTEDREEAARRLVDKQTGAVYRGIRRGHRALARLALRKIGEGFDEALLTSIFVVAQIARERGIGRTKVRQRGVTLELLAPDELPIFDYDPWSLTDWFIGEVKRQLLTLALHTDTWPAIVQEVPFADIEAERRAGRYRIGEAGEDEDLSFAESTADERSFDGFREVEAREYAQWLARIAGLNAAECRLFNALWLGQELADIARSLGIGRNAFDVRLSRLRAKLQKTVTARLDADGFFVRCEWTRPTDKGKLIQKAGGFSLDGSAGIIRFDVDLEEACKKQGESSPYLSSETFHACAVAGGPNGGSIRFLLASQQTDS